MDRLDSKDRHVQVWIRCRIGFAAAAALRTLLDDLPDVAPGYFADLAERLSNAVSQGEVWSTDYPGEEPWDEYVPVQAPLGGPGAMFLPWSAAVELEEQLFPTGASDRDRGWLFRAAILLSLHSTFEAFAVDHGFRGGSLPDFFLQAVPSLPAVIDRPLRELDATRHVFAHAGGVVDPKYRDRTARRQVELGERRPLTSQHLDEFLRAAWQGALALRKARALEA